MGLIVLTAGADHLGALLGMPLDERASHEVDECGVPFGYCTVFLPVFAERSRVGGPDRCFVGGKPADGAIAGAKVYVMNLSAVLNTEMRGAGYMSRRWGRDEPHFADAWDDPTVLPSFAGVRVCGPVLNCTGRCCVGRDGKALGWYTRPSDAIVVATPGG